MLFRWCDVPIVLSPTKVAEVCEVSRNSVMEWLGRKKDPLPHQRTGDNCGKYLISRDSLRHWLMK